MNCIRRSLLACLLVGSLVSIAVGADQPRGRIAAPDFPAVQWLNTDKPISLTELRGQVVVLDFWTYACINCMHIFPDLRYLERKYHDQPVVIIGVHSGKFSQEKDAQNIRQAILRHNIAHPVAVDSNYEIWTAYGVNSWPTLVVIDPEGFVVNVLSGEGHRDELDRNITALLKTNQGRLGKHLEFRMERESFESGVLEFPGKVLADPAGKRLFISDTNHHRILVTDLDGMVQQIVGKAEPGLTDGGFARAQFNQPQGLALAPDGKTLYVADTENHAVRQVDLAAQTVTTIAGTGKQTRTFRADGPGKTTPLSSPWDLALVGRQLFIAMAGTHQIWVLDLDRGRVRVFTGTGREARVDGLNTRAAFAQPSGLATDGQHLYVADAEVSTIRVVDARPNGMTATVAGSGGLFDFGAVDGIGPAARFQHPLGVALASDRLFVADTFNHVIRQIDLKTKAVTTWLGTGKTDPGTPDKIGLFEPGGLSVGGDTLYIADTNHHRIVAVDIKTKQASIVDVRLPGATTVPASVPATAGS